MEEQSTEKNLKVESLHLIDVSSEDDSLLLTASPLLSDLPSSGLCGESKNLEAMSAGKVDSTDIHKQEEHLPQPSETLEPEIKWKTGKSNLRKSLAWDNAFFTSAGVLDAEELSSIIEGVERDGKQELPDIQEDICGSTESLSTLGSENLTLDAFETELFDDVRASIQKSTKNSYNASSTTSNAGSRDTESHLTSKAGKRTESHSTSKAEKGETEPHSSSKAGKAEKESHATRALKKVLAPQGTLKQKPASKKPGMGSVKLPNEASAFPQVSQPAARSGVSNSLLPKPPRVLGKANQMSATPTKRTSLGAHRVSIDDKNTKRESVTGRGAQPSKAPGLGNLRGVVPRPKQSLKCNSSVSSSSTKRSTSSSIDNSSSSSSDSIGRSSVNSIRQLIGSKSNNPNSSGPTIRTPSKIGKSKTRTGNSQLSAYLTSMPKLPSNISPDSSISEWSIESSSSAFTVNQWSESDNVKARLDTSSPRREKSENGDLHSAYIKNLPECKFSQGYENQVTESQSQPVEKALPDDATSSCSLPARPSGLRKPSPKIGFFDGVKGASRTPKGGVQSLLNLSTASKAAYTISSPKGSFNNTKAQKLQQPIKTVTGSGNINNAQNAALRVKPVSHLLQEPLNAATRVSSAFRSIKGAPVRSPKLQNSFSPKSGGDGLVKTGEATPEGLNRSECGKAEASADVVENLLASDIMANPKDGSSDTCVPIQGHSEVIGGTPIQSAIKCSDNDRDSDLSCITESPVHGQKNDNAHFSPMPSSENNTNLRIPFAVKNSLSDMEELEKLTALPLTENIRMEKS
ncbi:hypothetical protein RJ641_028235 [Dillenia turbinata]|uniref:Uncharacterized protein n=1 Tax=Dillenia turbinata TaxID=194707 RepID=A0AAN8ZQC2_9MAGN